MEFSVIILHYNSPGFLKLTLDSVIRAAKGMEAEILVADNHSANFDAESFRSLFPDVRFLVFDQNHGFAKGNNLAVRKASGKFIFLINPDVIVPENLFGEILPLLKKNKQAGIYGIRLMDGTGKFLPESKRNIPNWFNSIFKLSGLPLKKIISVKPYYNLDLQPEESGPNPVFVGAFMAFEKEKFFEIGGFDERYFMYGEDIDLSYSFLRKGWQNIYLGHLHAVHFKGESTPKNKTYQKHFVNAALMFHQKYHPVSHFFLSPFIKWAFKWHFLIAKKKKVSRASPQSNKVFYTGKDRKTFERLKKIYPAAQQIPLNEIELTGMVIFDARYGKYQDFINFMWENRKRNFTYRFVPSTGNILAGSDSPASRGEIISLF